MSQRREKRFRQLERRVEKLEVAAAYGNLLRELYKEEPKLSLPVQRTTRSILERIKDFFR